MDAIVKQIPDYETKRRNFTLYYEDNRFLFNSAEQATVNLVNLLLEQSEIKGTKTSSRIKDRSECIRKFELKYRTDLEKSGLDYEIRDYIGDLIGLRVICLYESDIPKIVNLIIQEFNVLKIENKSADLNERVKFGYKGTHVDAEINLERTKLPEYRRFSGMKVEIQVRSIVQDAWSEVDHRLKYKKQIPDSIKRRVIRLAALFELADQEFEEIRRQTEAREQELADQEIGSGANSASKLENKNSKDGAQPLDSISFSNFVQRRYKTYNFEPIKIDGFVDDIKAMDPDMNLDKFKSIFNSYFDITHAYRVEQREHGININPFTHMRHMLYLSDPAKFADMLYPSQRDGFTSWVDQNSNQATGT